MEKRVVPIMSGGVRILSLTTAEWAVVATAVIVLIAFQVRLLHIAAILGPPLFLYIVILSKLEENIFGVMRQNVRLPNVLFGYLRRPIPIEKMRVDDAFNPEK